MNLLGLATANLDRQENRSPWKSQGEKRLMFAWTAGSKEIPGDISVTHGKSVIFSILREPGWRTYIDAKTGHVLRTVSVRYTLRQKYTKKRFSPTWMIFDLMCVCSRPGWVHAVLKTVQGRLRPAWSCGVAMPYEAMLKLRNDSHRNIPVMPQKVLLP